MSRWVKRSKIGEILGDPYCCDQAMSEATQGQFICTNCGCSIGTSGPRRIDSFVVCDSHEQYV